MTAGYLHSMPRTIICPRPILIFANNKSTVSRSVGWHWMLQVSCWPVPTFGTGMKHGASVNRGYPHSADFLLLVPVTVPVWPRGKPCYTPALISHQA